MDAEEKGWRELQDLIGSLSPSEAERPGYFPEGWSVKDMLAHIGAWLAEAGVILERITVGTYRPEEIDVDALNEQFLEAMKDVPLPTVKIQASSARTRMRRAWRMLPDQTEDAAFWIRKSGSDHYDEHLPRLRDWVNELRSE
jgi:hypothetical protein